jgi:hypothetical protein
LSGVFLKEPYPELLGVLEILVEVGAVAPEAFGETVCGPVGDFVERALMNGGVVETLGQQGAEAVFFLPRVGQLARREAEALAGGIRAAGLRGDDEAAELCDEFEAVGAGDGIPAAPRIAVLESLGGTGPTQHGDEVFTAVFPVIFVNTLP